MTLWNLNSYCTLNCPKFTTDCSIFYYIDINLLLTYYVAKRMVYSLTYVVKSHFHLGSNNPSLFYHCIHPLGYSVSHETETANAIHNVVNNDSGKPVNYRWVFTMDIVDGLIWMLHVQTLKM